MPAQNGHNQDAQVPGWNGPAQIRVQLLQHQHQHQHQHQLLQHQHQHTKQASIGSLKRQNTIPEQHPGAEVSWLPRFHSFSYARAKKSILLEMTRCCQTPPKAPPAQPSMNQILSRKCAKKRSGACLQEDKAPLAKKSWGGQLPCIAGSALSWLAYI
eukprot:832887-Pelagomonas_calceolata.AAC.8